MPAASNFVNVRFFGSDKLIVTGESLIPEQIEVIHVVLAKAPAAVSASTPPPSGELIPLDAQIAKTLPGPVGAIWPVELDAPEDCEPGTLVVVGGVAVRRDIVDPDKPIAPDVWVSCSRILAETESRNPAASGASIP